MDNKTKHTVMLVDDSSTNNILYESILQDEGYNVIICEDAKIALKKLQKEIPDLILLDLMMPGMDGFDFMETIKRNENTAKIPVIMLTARVERESEQRALALGIKEYITKPVSITEISLKVKKYIG